MIRRAAESGTVPKSGIGSSFEQGVLEYVFNDGWFDHGAAREGDDYASVWKFSQNYRYIAVYSNFTDPILNDGFTIDDNELDAIGVFIGDPATLRCDVNTDGQIDRLDIALVFDARNTPTLDDDDARDFDGDGFVTVLDARACKRQCTFTNCAP